MRASRWARLLERDEILAQRAYWLKQKQGKIRKRRTNEGEHKMFSVLLVFAGCGSDLHFVW